MFASTPVQILQADGLTLLEYHGAGVVLGCRHRWHDWSADRLVDQVQCLAYACPLRRPPVRHKLLALAVFLAPAH